MAQQQEPTAPQFDSSLRSLLKEFLDPVRTDDSRADFYTIYRRESESFDRDYVGKHGQDLDTSLLFAGLFSSVSAAFVTSIQQDLKPDPSEVAAAYMQLLIHTMNGTLFPHASPDSITSASADRPPNIVAVQAILYASLATSLFAAFLATLGKQWINRYIRNDGGSTAEKSQDRQQKLDALRDWRFRLVVESLPVMLQLALLLLGCALSIYLWTINHTVARVIVAFTSLGVALYALFTVTAVFSPTCPYQTPISILVRALIRGTSASFRSMRSGVAFSVSNYSNSTRLKQALGYLRSGIRDTQGHVSVPFGNIDDPQRCAVKLHTWNFGEVSVNREDYGDARCVSWVLGSAADDEVVFSTARFAVDMTLYPEIADILPPLVLANHFLGCVSDSRMIRGGLERTSMVGMAFASVLSIQLCMKPYRDDLLRLSNYIRNYMDWIPSSEPTVPPGVAILEVVLQNPGPVQDDSFRDWKVFANTPHDLPSPQKLCLSRTILQTVWRWRCTDPVTAFNLDGMGSFCNTLMANSGHIIPALKTNCFLVMAISLGAWADGVHKLFTPNTERALHTAINTFHEQLRNSVRTQNADAGTLTSILSALVYLDPFQVPGTEKWGFEWINVILNSKYSQDDRHRMAVKTMQPLEKYFSSKDLESPPAWIFLFTRFLSEYKELFALHPAARSRSIALYILSASPAHTKHLPATVPLLTLTLSRTHPLQLRCSALKAFYRFVPGWFSTGNIADKDFEDLLQAVDDPFQLTLDPSLPAQPIDATGYDSMMAAIVLIEFVASDQWRNHLPASNFTSCETLVSTDDGRDLALGCLSDTVAEWPEFLHTSSKVNAAVTHLEGIQCPNVAQVVKTWAQRVCLL